MKTKFNSSLLIFVLASLVHQASAHAGYNVYPPLVKDQYSFFEDSDNAKNALSCATNPDAVCINATYLPIGIKLSRNENNIPMLTQGLFFSYASWWQNAVVYNMTLEPDYGNPQTALVVYKQELAGRYGLKPQNVNVSPMNVTGVQFILRNAFGSNLPNDAAHTVFTQTLVPNWTGDYHMLGSRFSVSVKGPMWDLEPAMQNMFLNPAGNAVVGQVSFGFPVQASVYDQKISCDVRKFQSVINNTVKSWNVSHVQNGHTIVDSFNNDERNALRATLDIKDYCQIETFTNAMHPDEDAFKARSQEIFKTLFDQAFRDLNALNPIQNTGGHDPKYTSLDLSSQSDAHGLIELEFKDVKVFELKSDLDFYVGNITAANLDPAHIYMCQHFEKYDLSSRACVVVCDPVSEVYLPSHSRAASNGCVNIQNGTSIIQGVN